jgi:hypothetical protein
LGKVFLIGFSEDEARAVKGALPDVDVLCVPEECREWTLAQLIEGSPNGRCDWHERKFLIINGSNELVKRVLSSIKDLSLGRVIFVSTVPAAMGRTLEDLIGEWIEEDEYFATLREARRKAMKGPYLDIGKG